MSNFIRSILAMQAALAGAFAVAQDDENYATYINEEQW